MPTSLEWVTTILGSVQYSDSVIRLYTEAPTDESPGVPVTGGGYADTLGNFSVNPSNFRQLTNLDTVTFTMPECTVVALGIAQGVDPFTVFYYDNFTTPLNFASGDTFEIAPGMVILEIP